MHDARTIHDWDQFNAAIADLPKQVSDYRKAMIAGGYSEAEAYASSQAAEVRLWELHTARLEAKRKGEDQRVIEKALEMIEGMIKRRALISEDEDE